MIIRHQRQLAMAFIAAASVVAVAFGIAGRVTASPSLVLLQAGSCYGYGESAVGGGGGGGSSTGCTESSRYLSTSIGFEDTYVKTYPGAWYTSDVFRVLLDGYQGHGAVTAVGSTHNLAWLGNVNGYVGTNTW